MKQTLLVLLFLSACQAASPPAEEDLSFEDLFAAQDDALLASDLSAAYQLAERRMRELDAALDTDDQPLDSDTYAELQALHAMLDAGRHASLSRPSLARRSPLERLALAADDDAQTRDETYESWSAQFRAEGMAVQPFSSSFARTLERRSRELRDDLRNARGHFTPGLGAAGNMSGNEFPDGTWAITYDDGPSKVHTPKVLAELQKRQLQATFFHLAQQIRALPAVAMSVFDAGMPIANHSYTHPQLSKVSLKVLRHEIVDSTQVQVDTYGVVPEYFRCPYGDGASSSRIRKMLGEQNMVHVAWNVDTLDWQDKIPASIVKRTLKQVAKAKHGVILFHDIHPQSVIASAQVMDELLAQGARLVSIPQIAAEL